MALHARSLGFTLPASVRDIVNRINEGARTVDAYAHAGQAAVDAYKDPRAAIQHLAIRTAWLPDVDIDQPFADDGLPADPPPAHQRLLRLLQPQITATIKGVPTPLVYAPYGAPPPTKWPILAAAGATGLLAVVFFGIRGIAATVRGR